MNDERLDRLIDAHLDDALTAAERIELDARLLDSDHARRRFWELAEVHGLAGDAARCAWSDAAAEGDAIAAGATKSDPPAGRAWETRLPTTRVTLAIGAALALSALLAIVATLAFRGERRDEPSAAIATVTGALRAATRDAEPLAVGRRLGAGTLALAAGSIELTFASGVTLLLEGPAELELVSTMRAALAAGQAVVRAPEDARGFELDTVGARIVESGVEFGVKCDAAGATDLLVFEGEVVATSAIDKTGFPQQLTRGRAARFSPREPRATEIPYRPERFVRRLPADAPVELEEAGSPLFNETRIEEIAVLRPERPLTIDGDLSDWSAAGAFRAEKSPREWIEGRMRYDADYLYVAARVGDPAPLRNVTDPDADGELGWRGGGLQVRLSTDRAVGWPVDANAPVYYQFRRLPPDAAQLSNATNPRLAHLTLWNHAPTSRPCLHVAYGMDFHGGAVNPAGFRGAFAKTPDGAGYTLEYAIPWTILHAEADPPRAGDALAVSWTTHWSDDGRLWRGQLVELRNASEPTRIHTWERAATWGRAAYR